MPKQSTTTNVLVPTGALGAGIQEELVSKGIAAGAHVIACDAGSTDSGPSYLSSGKCKYSRAAIKADLKVLMRAQAKARIPLLIGSCGTSGSDAALDWTKDIALEIAEEEELRSCMVVIYSEQGKAEMREYARAGRITPLAPMRSIEQKMIDECSHIVALTGPEPYIDALRTGADIVLGGRTSDAAVLAAYPLLQGQDPGAAWHAGKIAECGGLCTIDPRGGGVMIRVGKDGFEVEPLSASNRCTPESVSAHMLYENSDPFHLLEPGGVLDVTQATYEALDGRRVRVQGSRFVPGPYTMKVEGAGATSYQTIMLVGIQDPKVLTELPRFLKQMHRALKERVQVTMGEAAGNFDISLRPYGWNAVSGIDDPATLPPREIGLLFVATACTQEIATQIAKTCNPWFFHMPLNRNEELPSYAFPFSPAEIERGQVHAFLLNHIISVDQPSELVRAAVVDER